mgnify:CR=1 FL=1
MRNNLTNNPSSSVSITAGEGVLVEQNGDIYTITMEASVPYATRIDQAVDGLTYYTGFADVGSSTSSAVWRVKKTVLSDTSDDVVITWADGNANFDNIWDNRLSLTYS